MKQARSIKKRFSAQYIRYLNENGSTKRLYEIFIKDPNKHSSRFCVIECLNTKLRGHYDSVAYIHRFDEYISQPIGLTGHSFPDSSPKAENYHNEPIISPIKENVKYQPIQPANLENPTVPIQQTDIPPSIDAEELPQQSKIPSKAMATASQKDFLADITDAYDLFDDISKPDQFSTNIFSDSHDIMEDLPQNPFESLSTDSNPIQSSLTTSHLINDQTDTVSLWSELQNTFADSLDFNSSYTNLLKSIPTESIFL